MQNNLSSRHCSAICMKKVLAFKLHVNMLRGWKWTKISLQTGLLVKLIPQNRFVWALEFKVWDTKTVEKKPLLDLVVNLS